MNTMNTLILFYGFLLAFAIGMGFIARREARRYNR
jgi:uncharacterized membrane protein